MINNNQNIPKLRFKGFEGEWENCKLSDSIASLDAGVSVNSDDYPVMEGELGVLKTSCVSQGFFNQKQNKVVKNEVEIKRLREPVKKETIIISRMNTPDLVGANAVVWNDIPNLFLPDRLWSAKIKKNNSVGFLGQYLASKKTRYRISARATGTSNSMKNVSKGDIFTLKIDLPTFGEQQKIADFLGKVDDWTENLKEQKENLEKYKKGMMQKIFAQKIRFMDKNAKEFEEWEKIKLGKLVKEYSEKTKINNQHKVLSSTMKGVVLQSEYFNKTIASNDNVGYKILKKDQLVFSPQNLWLGNINFCDRFDIGIVSPSYKVYDINEKLILLEYFKKIIKLPRMIYEYIISSEQGASVVRRGLNMDLFNMIPVLLPSLLEQQKIAEFLTSIDKLIDSKQEQIAKAEEWKKGLMQGLFV